MLNTKNAKRLGFKITEKGKTLPITYWIPKMHKNPTGACFIIAFKICSAKQISTSVSNIFKLVFFQIESFLKNAKFLLNYKTFYVLQNSDLIIHSLNNMNKKTCQIYLLHTKLPHYGLKSKLLFIVDFAFKGG